MTKKVDYKNFSKIADLTVERVELKNGESLKFCETETINRYREKKMVCTCFKTWLCARNSVREKNERRLTGGTILVDEIKLKNYKNEENCRNYVIRNLCLELSFMFIRDYL